MRLRLSARKLFTMEPVSRDDLFAGLTAFFCALGILMLPLRWIAGIALAVLCHEGGHLLALRLMVVPVQRIQVKLLGLQIETYVMSPIQEFFAASAGPLASFLLLLTRKRFPELALCGAFQGVYNLLPIYPSDGGRMLRAALYKLSEDKKEKLLRVIGNFTWILLSVGVCMLPVRACFMITAWFLFVFWSRFRNIPCKDARKEVK